MQTDDFFRARLDQMIDLRYPLAVLANRMPWAQIESTLAPAFERRNRSGQGKGKARKPYEFGVKASIAVTHKQGLIVGARSFPGNPYDGHTLKEQLEQTSILLEDVGVVPRHVMVDLGFRGVDRDNPKVQIIHRGKAKSLNRQQRRWLKRRQAVEPTIGHLKADHRMDRCWLVGSIGDALHTSSCRRSR